MLTDLGIAICREEVIQLVEINEAATCPQRAYNVSRQKTKTVAKTHLEIIEP